MELRQVRYFVAVAELGSMGRAAAELGLVTSALSQQISRLESELATRLLQRSKSGVVPTDAGLAFLRQAQLMLRHADAAMQAARQSRLSGQVSIGLAPTTASVLGLPLIEAMRARYPDVRLHLVEALSGHLAQMLNARQIDLAVLFRADNARRWSVLPLLEERLFLIGLGGMPGMPKRAKVRLARIGELPLVLPSGPHGLRAIIDAAFGAAGAQANVACEIDSLALLMDAVRAGLYATIQPGAASARLDDERLVKLEVGDAPAARPNLLASLSDDELSPAGLAARVVIADVTRALVAEGRWPGARLSGNG